MTEKICDLAIIGGGPAGMAAAATAAAQGASTLLIDDSKSLGGHFYKQLPEDFENRLPTHDDKVLREFQSRALRLANSRAEVLDQARVWGIFPSTDPRFQIYAEHQERDTVSIAAKTIILAPGVYDRPLPFSGWELPGVMTPGAVQIMLKKQGLLPGKRILVCGTGPLQLVIAAALVEAGADVVALLDSSGMLDGIMDMPAALGGLKSRMDDFIYSLRILVGKRVPILFHHAIFQALGNQQTGVEGAVIGKITPEGHPISGTNRSIEADCICCGYGFIPSTALTLHLGCEHVYNSNLGAYIPRHDDNMRSSVPDVYVAGDVTGVGGKPLADLQGTVAAISALERLSILPVRQANELRAQYKHSLQREERFSDWLWSRYRIREGLLDLADEDTLICRCENVTVGELKRSIKNGSQNLYGTKLRTRLGMGSCQGRYCMMNAAIFIARQTGIPIEETGIHSIRPPLIPVRLENIAAK
jgi:NADPH-dependent 2,4-dienoyl-CoA reductase/sulfur reductase-like enzyme